MLCVYFSFPLPSNVSGFLKLCKMCILSIGYKRYQRFQRVPILINHLCFFEVVKSEKSEIPLEML